MILMADEVRISFIHFPSPDILIVYHIVEIMSDQLRRCIGFVHTVTLVFAAFFYQRFFGVHDAASHWAN
jgi:hypothetical protein